MFPRPHFGRLIVPLLVGAALRALSLSGATLPVVTASNVTIRIAAAIVTGDSQVYDDAGIRIFQGLKPDIVAIQEFNYGGNSTAALRTFVNTAFGTGFSYFRETGYSIPNGVISRWPILASGSWDDTELSDRGFAWARIDVPGSNDLYVVSVHWKADSSSAARRSNQATQVKTLIQAQFPAGSWVVLGGDFNIHDASEAALATCKTYLSDNPIPTDAVSGGDPDTNLNRNERYDYLLPNLAFATNLVSTVIGSQSFTRGLVFDSRVFSPLSAVAPVASGDSATAQHMAVVKDFRVRVAVTNWVTVPQPTVTWSNQVLRWNGVTNFAYLVESRPMLTTNSGPWTVAATVSSTTGLFVWSVPPSTNSSFFRVRVP